MWTNVAAILAVAVCAVQGQTQPSVSTENGELVFEAAAFKFKAMSSYPALIAQTKIEIQEALASNSDPQPLLDLLKEYNEALAAEDDAAFTLGGIKAELESQIAANTDSVSDLKASVDALVTDTIAGIKNEIAASESDQNNARNALEDKLASQIATVVDRAETANAAVTGSINALEGEINKADKCGSAGKLYTKAGGCKEIEIPDTNLLKYEPQKRGCSSTNAGMLEYSTVSGQVCLMICTSAKWTPVNNGQYGEQCNPAKDCADVATKKLPSGQYQFIYSVSNSVVTHSKKGYCDVNTKKVSYDGSSANNYALSCEMVFAGFPGSGSGEYWIGADAKSAKKTTCIYITPGPDKRVPTNSMVAWYDAADYDGGAQWKGRPGSTMNNPSLYGTRPVKAKGGEGAHAGYESIKGYTRTHRIRWNNIIPSGSWTFCTTSKYDSGRRGRIFTGGNNNWLHGHWGGNAGSSYHQGWNVNGALNSKRTQWLAWCGTTGSGDSTRSTYGNTPDMRSVKRYSHRRNMPRTSYVGTGVGVHSGEASDYRIGSVISWRRGLTDAEMKNMVMYLIDRIKGKAN